MYVLFIYCTQSSIRIAIIAAARAIAAGARAIRAAETIAIAGATTEAAFMTATTETTSAGWAWLHRTCFVHHQGTATHVLTMQASDGCLCFGVAAHFNKTETFGTASVAFHHHFGAAYITVLCEKLLQIVITNRIRQIAYI